MPREQLELIPATRSSNLGITACAYNKAMVLSAHLLSLEFDTSAEMGDYPSPDKVGIVVPAPVIFLGFLLVGLVLNFVIPLTMTDSSSLLLAVGFVLIVAATLIASLSVREMKKSGTSPDPSKLPSKLVTDGPFSFTRNPIYFSFVLGYVGLALAFNLFWSLPLIGGALISVDRLVIVHEEEYLEAKFGEDYVRYKSKTHRWL